MSELNVSIWDAEFYLSIAQFTADEHPYYLGIGSINGPTHSRPTQDRVTIKLKLGDRKLPPYALIKDHLNIKVISIKTICKFNSHSIIGSTLCTHGILHSFNCSSRRSYSVS